MGIPRIYRGLPEVNLASYDFYDLFTGTGYKAFYLCDTYLVGTDQAGRGIVTNIIYSRLGYSGTAAASDFDFDLDINVPISIEGNLYFSIGYYSGATIAQHPLLTFNLYAVDSVGVETQIGTSIIKTTNNGENLQFVGKLVCPLTRIGKGGKLRVNILFGAATDINYIYHDPANRVIGSSGTNPTNARIYLPIKI